MAKSRMELLEAILKGADYLSRPDITTQEKEVAQRKYDRYVEELDALDKQPEIPDDPFDLEPDTTPVPEQPQAGDPAAMWIEAIRSKLQPVKEGMKRRGAV